LSRTVSPLVVFPGALGDFVCVVPALRELEARTGRRVALFCKGDLTALAQAAGLADAMAMEDRRVSWLFSAKPPPEADCFFGGFASIDSFSGAGVAEVERNLRRWQGVNGRVHPFRAPDRAHLAVHFLRSLGAAHGRSTPPEARLSLDPSIVEHAAARFASLDRPLLVVHPGSGGVSKRWSRAGFVRLARRWRERGGSVVISLGPVERAETGEWGAHGDAVAANLDVVGTAGLLARCDAYLGNDSGVSHLAAAMGAQGVALFGPTDPQQWRPLSSRIVSLRLEPWAACDAAPSPQQIERVARALERAGESP
jgi:heptosyltransferase-3